MNAWLNMLALVLVIVGALNWGLVGLANVDLVQYLSHPMLIKGAYILVGLSAVMVGSKRDFYLPFLGKAVFPCAPLQPKTPQNANASVEITTTPDSNVVYWAAEEGSDVGKDPWVAYGTYANAGVTRSDSAGRAVLRVRAPAAYKVPLRGQLAPHVHYRTCTKPGKLGPVMTAKTS